jgi:hypothetical protein
MRVGALLAALALPLAAAAQPATVPAGDTAAVARRPALQLSGYVSSLTGIHDAGFDAPGFERRSGFHGQLARLAWRVESGEAVSLSVHSRVQARVASTATGIGDVAGIGVSVIPGRPVDLSTRLLDQERLELWHDIDRLALTVRTPAADVTLGRQAITWGLAHLFPVADLWAQFSPFEFDTAEKPGADAVRVLTYPRAGLELDAVLAARARAEDWSAAVRATLELPAADVYLAAGKFWNQLMLLGGAAYVLERVTLRAEVGLPWDLDAREATLPRATLGVDRFGARLTLSGEYHHNGIGATRPDDYVARFADARVRRGETYLVGRHYVGGALRYLADADGRLSLSVSSLWNQGDGSAALTPMLGYDLGQSASLSVGTLQTLGRRPRLDPPALRSEFGTYGRLWFTQVSVYF